MININELRRLAQAALIGPDGFSMRWLKLLKDFQEEANPATITELLDRLEAAESDALEQARLNGMGASREAALMAKLEAAEWDRATFIMEIGNLCTKVEALREQLSKQRSLSQAAQHLAEVAQRRADALRAKITEMERQEQARLVTPTAYRWRYRGAIKWQYGELTEEAARLAKEHNHEVQPLYALPGAQPAPSVPEGWLRAIDEALVVAHIGVANAEDTYEQAKAKLDNLVGFHVDIAIEPAVNGGWKLVPSVPDVPAKSLKPVIDWLRNGCDPMKAADELEILIAAAPEAKP